MIAFVFTGGITDFLICDFFFQIQNVSSRSERVFIESRQLKICVTCFDLSVALIRVLEMTAVLALPIFTDVSRPASNRLLSRLCQVREIKIKL